MACGAILKSPQPFGWGLFILSELDQQERTRQPSSALFLGWRGCDLAHEG